ncbi:MAG: ABC-F family ATP-binding cassette domain-containing protein [Clostridiales bacterium]|nr:ABC-F family ATP-binding cassette domain-containing protein [Clostridiales bacterium]
MIDISVNNLTKSFTVGEDVLRGLTFHVGSGERVGLLGKNGCGKTTLFKILTGEYDYDEGEVFLAPGKRMGLISQIPIYPADYTVDDVLDSAFTRVHKMEREMESLTAKMAAGDSSKETLQRYDSLSAAFQLAGGYDLDVQIGKVSNGLGISPAMRRQPFSELSGGEKTRVNLGRLILEDTDILLLDEPTNHLDLHAVEWLEGYLDSFKGTVLAISHDRYFLDRVVKRIVEIQDGRAEFYSGNYSFYVEEKERRYQERLRQYEKEQAKVAQLTEAAEKMKLWAFLGNDKLYKRAFSMEKRMEKLQTVEKPVGKERAMTMGFTSLDFQGDEVFTVDGLKKSYEDRTLFDHISLSVTGGERIALLGDNGTGKTTFLKLLLGEEAPDSGYIHFGPAVRPGYLPQIVRFDHMERSLVDTMLYEQNCTPQEARDRLGAFHFRGEDVFKPVSALSGGELSRLKLCLLMDERINLLILDEPTNHLDIASREWIESAVAGFDGALLFVSHDRYFIKKFASRIWTLEDGKITDFRGDYEGWLAKQARDLELREVLKPEAKKPKKEKPKQPGGTKLAAKKLAQLEREIAAAEQAGADLEAEMAAYATDYAKLTDLTAQKERQEEQLAALYEAWEELSLQLEGEA